MLTRYCEIGVVQYIGVEVEIIVLRSYCGSAVVCNIHCEGR